jgi:MFS family permease
LWSRAFVVLCVLSFFGGFATAPHGSLFPVYVDVDLGRPALFTGYLRGLALCLGGIFAIVGGRLCDVLGLKATLLLGLAGSALTGLVFHSTEVLSLTALILVIGAAGGPQSTAGQSYLIASAGPARLGLGGALYFLSGTSGQAVGNFCTGLVKDEWSFPELGTAMTTAMAAVFVAGILLLPSTSVARDPGAGRQKLALWSSYRPLLAQGNVRLLVALRFSITSFWGMASLALPLLVARTSGSAATAAFYGSLSLAVASAGQLLTGLLRDRFGRTRPLVVSSLGIVASAVGAAIYHDSVTGLFLFGTALSTTAWAVSTLVPALIDEVADTEEKNRLVGLGHLVWSGAMVTGSVFGGWLVEVASFLPFAYGVVSCSVGTLCIWWLCVRLDARREAQ